MDAALFQENERTAPVSDERLFVDIGEYECEVAGTIPTVTVAYETWGTLNQEHSNAILVCHALTGDAHAIGWWDRLIGPGKPIDTDRFFVIGSNCLGGCQGTTGPASRHPDGTPYRLRFPIVTVGDMVNVQAKLLDHLGIDRLYAVAGGSMGGMQALEWTVRYPNRVRKAFITASCAAHSAMQIGFNETARQAIMQDPNWMEGNYPEGSQPDGGLAVSRMIGHLSFLSDAAFTSKFGRNLQDKDQFEYTFNSEFQVESYLCYQGQKFTRRFDANSLLYVTKAIDYFDCKDLSPSQADYLFVSFTTDWLYPTYQSRIMHDLAIKAGLKSRHVEVDLPYGHDAFLLDGQLQGAHVRDFLAD